MFSIRFRRSKFFSTSSNAHEIKEYSSPIFLRLIVVVKEEIWEPILSGSGQYLFHFKKVGIFQYFLLGYVFVFVHNFL
ncbi:hypothetical protein AMTRI_Chr07g27430 [Amborella trichopoda]